MVYDIQARPQFYARLAGALYLAVIVLGGLAEGYVTNALVVPGDDLGRRSTPSCSMRNYGSWDWPRTWSCR